MQTINIDGRNYKLTKSVVSGVSGFGAGLAIEALLIPFAKATFPNSRLLRLVCLTGIMPIAGTVGLITKGVTEAYMDMMAETWNNIVSIKSEVTREDISNWFKDATNKETKNEKELTKDPKNLTPDEEHEIAHNFVADTKLLVFDTETKAQSAATKLLRMLNLYGHCDLAYFAAATGTDVPSDYSYDILLKYGWAGSDFTKDSPIAVERVNNNVWVVDAFNYHDISDVYQTISEIVAEDIKEN